MSYLPDLQVYLGSSRTGGSPGRCTDVASLEERMLATVEFPAAEAPCLALGEKVDLEFRSSELDLCVDSEALTLLRTDAPTRRLYGFRCDISKRAFLHLLSRRRVPRVRISPSRALPVILLDAGDPNPQATLYDVSSLGLSILLDRGCERRLFERLQLQLSLELPGDGGILQLRTAIRHRRLLEEGVLYGLEVDGRDPESARCKERLDEFVAHLRKQATPRSGTHGQREHRAGE